MIKAISNKWYKREHTDAIWWLDNPDSIGEWVFSFDKKRAYNMFRDYPHELTKKEKEIFDKENPYWADFLVTDIKHFANDINVGSRVLFFLYKN